MGADHEHDWIANKPWRVCGRCLLVQSHDGKRWRNAPKAIQGYVKAQSMLAVIYSIVTHPDVVSRLPESMRRAFDVLAKVTEP